MEMEMICKNCEHWGQNKVHVSQYDERGICVRTFEAAPCKVWAVEPDAGQCVPMFGEDGHCKNGAQAFKPSQDYIDELEYDRGVKAGIDYPATM